MGSGSTFFLGAFLILFDVTSAFTAFSAFAMPPLYKARDQSTIAFWPFLEKTALIEKGLYMSFGRKIGIGLVSTLTALVLALAFLISIANVMVASASHVGESAATVVKQVSADPDSLNSIIDEFEKSADSKLAAEIKKNRAQINEAVSSLGSSREFRDLIASTLDQISKAALAGSPSVSVDFSKIATAIASKVNVAAKSTVISNKDIANIKPTVLDLSKNSQKIVDIKSKIRLALVIWFIFVVLVALGYWLRGIKVFRAVGIQFLSLGIVGLATKFLTPTIVNLALRDSSGPSYQRKVIPEIVNSLGSPIFVLSAVFGAVGVILIVTSMVILGKKKVLVAS